MADLNGVHTSDNESLTKRNSAVGGTEETGGKRTFQVYKRRWAVLVAVTLLNISNASLWINISPVATKVAEYFERDLLDINWFSLVFLFISIPFCFISTFSVNKVGLMPAIHIGSALNCLGGLVRALATAGIFKGNLTAEFALCLTGQVIAGMAQSFLLFIPTKVSQLWFPDDARALSTTILSLSNPLGVVVAMVASPLLVNGKEDFPLLNWVFGGLAIATEVITIICVTKSKPPTPPSASAEEDSRGEQIPYLQQLKNTFTCIPYLFLLVALGTGVAFFSALATVTQQILCPLGYSDEFGGLVNAVMILCGFVGSAITGITVDRTKQFTPVTKLCYGLAALMGIVLLESFLLPYKEPLIATFSGLFGLFGVGAYPIGLELAVEATYPVDQTISTAFIFMSGQLQGVIIIAMVGGLARDQKAKYEDIQVCTKSATSEIEPKDYTVSLLAIMCMLVIVVVLTIIFMETPYKRLAAERAAMKVSSAAESVPSPGSTSSHSLNEYGSKEDCSIGNDSSRKKSGTSSHLENEETTAQEDGVQSRL